ncbi:hypothetical protein HanRHA438_Chr01g0009911 [Helianthus annuus]|nr:hypothetical protein HanRHA438_Chr01g0009911 [Helianthus annuus]
MYRNIYTYIYVCVYTTMCISTLLGNINTRSFCKNIHRSWVKILDIKSKIIIYGKFT